MIAREGNGTGALVNGTVIPFPDDVGTANEVTVIARPREPIAVAKGIVVAVNTGACLRTFNVAMLALFGLGRANLFQGAVLEHRQIGELHKTMTDRATRN
jgi:hypothetical protein